jgi:LemA protein
MKTRVYLICFILLVGTCLFAVKSTAQNSADAPGKVKFRVGVNVPGAIVELDGAAVGTAPGAFQTIAGEHKLRVTSQGYRAFEQDVVIMDNAAFSVSLATVAQAQRAEAASNGGGFIMLWVMLGVIICLIFWGVDVYNKIIRLDQDVKDLWSRIDIFLKRRHDLILNLVETAKGYMAHEKDTLEGVTKARQMAVDATNIKDKIQAENMLTSTLRSIMSVVENYPDLKANVEMLRLHDELTSTENSINEVRQNYNESVKVYNIAIKTIPNSIIAALARFEAGVFFKLDSDAERQAPQVKF